jgi:hypothetical protein
VDGPAAAKPAKAATADIPIVFTLATDPVADGLVASMARPGGNLTGLTLSVGYELVAKRVELLKDIKPDLARLAILRNPANPSAGFYLQKRQAGAPIEGDQSRSVGDRTASAAAAAGRSRCTGQQDGAYRLGGDAAPERIPAPGCGGLVGHGASAGTCERIMTRDGTVGRSDATERSLPVHWDIDPARMMRPRFADSIRARQSIRTA